MKGSLNNKKKTIIMVGHEHKQLPNIPMIVIVDIFLNKCAKNNVKQRSF